MDHDESHVWRLRDGAAAWQQIDGETVLLDLAASEYLGINGSGSLLWGRLVGGATRSQLADVICGAYAVPADQAAADVDVFLRECATRGLVE